MQGKYESRHLDCYGRCPVDITRLHGNSPAMKMTRKAAKSRGEHSLATMLRSGKVKGTTKAWLRLTRTVA